MFVGPNDGAMCNRCTLEISEILKFLKDTKMQQMTAIKYSDFTIRESHSEMIFIRRYNCVDAGVHRYLKGSILNGY